MNDFNYDDEIVVNDAIGTIFDSQEIKELTMKKIHKHEHEKPAGHTRKFAVVLAAAALAALLMATAFAAYHHFFIAEQFDGYFGDLTEPQMEFIEQIGKSELPAGTVNETTLTPLAVIGDDVSCYMKFRLEAPENMRFPTDGEELKRLHINSPDDQYRITDENGTKLPVSESEIQWTDTEPGDNVLEFIVRFNSNMMRPAHFNDGTSTILTIQGIWLEGLDKEYTKLLDGPWSFDIGFYDAAAEKMLDVDDLDVKRMFSGVEYKDEGMSVTLRYMSISLLALTYAYGFTCSDPRTIPGPSTICIVMKDGSIVEVMKADGICTDSYWASRDVTDAPVDLNEVDYVQFGNQQIKVNWRYPEVIIPGTLAY